MMSSQNDLRLRDLIKNWEGQEADVALVGVPWDEGIVAGGGRPGAAGGPDAVRKAIQRFGTVYFLERDLDISGLRIVDFGDVKVVAGDVVETHLRVSQVVKDFLSRGILPIVIGGGHDISFASIRGLVESLEEELVAEKGDGEVCRIGGVNVDAHFDVRPVVDGVISSGTPFWRGMEELDGKFVGSRFVEMGMSLNCNARAHRDYLLGKGARIISLEEYRRLKGGCGRENGGGDDFLSEVVDLMGENAFLSIDIDVVQQAFAPGCSAPAPVGMRPEEILELAEFFGKCGSVKLFDLMEVSPEYDVDGRTARLAAAVISAFLLGYAQRF